MPVESKHPSYNDRIDEWRMMRDVVRGSKAVKESGVAYLPMPDGFTVQSDSGTAMYGAYQMRARFPDIVRPTRLGMVGVIHRIEAQITIPKALEPMLEWATVDGLPIEAVHSQITAELLSHGRYSLLVDVSAEGSNIPYIAGYDAEALINWAEDRSLYVLDESGLEMEGFDWRDVKRHRVLRLENGAYTVEVHDNNAEQATQTYQPMGRAGRRIEEIPFVVIGPTELALEPEDPPLLGVAEAALAIFRLDADYRHTLFRSGQETFVVTGVGEKDPLPTVVGAGVVIGLPVGADAKYVGIAGNGLAAMRTALIDERESAVAAGARLFEGGSKAAESGEALRLRYSAQTASLTTVAKASAAGLEKALRHAAVFVGANPDEVVVKPNLKFVDTTLEPSQAKALTESWQAGAFSYETLYENLQRGGIASEERTADEEKALLETENPLEPPTFDGGEDMGNDTQFGAAA